MASGTDPMQVLKQGVTVGKLREMLAEYPDDTPVVVPRQDGYFGHTRVGDVREIWYAPISVGAGEGNPVEPDVDGEQYMPGAQDVKCVYIEGIN